MSDDVFNLNGQAVARDLAVVLAERDDLRARLARVETLADVVRRLQQPDPDTGDRDVSFFALIEALEPDTPALAPRPSAHAEQEGDRCGPVEIDEHDPSDPNCDYAPQDAEQEGE